jgi:hypothetical protein
MGTVEERYEDWLRLATELAVLLHLEIEFTTEYFGCNTVACAEVSGTDPHYGTFSYSGPTRINY